MTLRDDIITYTNNTHYTLVLLVQQRLHFFYTSIVPHWLKVLEAFQSSVSVEPRQWEEMHVSASVHQQTLHFAQ